MNKYMRYASFMSIPKTKLKFSPELGQDVKLPQPNPETQFPCTSACRPQKTPEGRDALSEKMYSFPFKDRNTGGIDTHDKTNFPVGISDISIQRTQMSPVRASSSSSVNAVSNEHSPTGVEKKEMSSDDTPIRQDTRKTVEIRSISKIKRPKEAKGLLINNDENNYYRRVLNAL